MANLRRLIDLDKIDPIYFPSTEMDGLDVVRYLNTLPTVDAVPVGEIIFHHLIIDKDGIPELKLQLGERTLTLRKKDPLDVVEVVRCKKCINGIYDESNNIYKCVKSTNYDPEYNDWFGFVSYHNADYYCADGERRTDG